GRTPGGSGGPGGGWRPPSTETSRRDGSLRRRPGGGGIRPATICRRAVPPGAVPAHRGRHHPVHRLPAPRCARPEELTRSQANLLWLDAIARVTLAESPASSAIRARQRRDVMSARSSRTILLTF